MKTLTSVAAMVALALSIGAAYADDFTISKDVGSELFRSAFPAHEAKAIRTDEVAVVDTRASLPNGDELPALNAKNDIGSLLYAEAFEIGDVVMAKDIGIGGSAAGGMAKDDERTVIWDNLMGTPGGSDY